MNTCVRVAVAAGLMGLGTGAFLSGCESTPAGAGGAGEPEVTLGQPPAYAEVAKAFNANASRLGRFRAQAVMRVTFINKDGQRSVEECDGLLQVVRPDKMALSFRKVSQPLFWLGSSESTYWWLDLTGDEPFGVYGRHENFGPRQAQAISVAIQPLDLIRLLGCVPLPEGSGAGVTQWSKDGSQVGVTTSLGRGQRQRLWLNPKTYLPEEVELFDPRGTRLMYATLAAHDSVRQFNDGSISPQLATIVRVYQLAQQTELRLELAGLQDGSPRSERPISEDAFDLAKLTATFKVAKVYDLDAGVPEASSAEPAGSPASEPRPAAAGAKPGATSPATPAKPSATPVESGRAPR